MYERNISLITQAPFNVIADLVMSRPVRNSPTTRRGSKSRSHSRERAVSRLSNEELRARLIALGVNAGPITSTTRAVYEKQLEKKLQQNKLSGTPSDLSDDLTNVIEERQFPTPPRPTMLLRPVYSSIPSHSLRSVNRNSDSSGKNLASSRARRRLLFNDSREELNVSGKKMVSDSDSDSDDDHMESSRIVTMSSSPVSGAHKPFSILSALKKHLNIWISFFLPRKSSLKSSEPPRSFHRGYPYSFREPAPTRSTILGFDISRVLLFFLISLFGFLLIAYLATANSGALIQGGRIAYICGIVGGIYMLRLYQTKKKAEEKRLIFDLVEKITDIIRDANEQGQIYVAEPHVRDMLLPPSKRMRNSPEWRRWQEAVEFINMNESRVSTETRIVNGVECSVWRWIPVKSSGWQGNAFGGNIRRSMADHAPSHCLKLRGMFSPARIFKDHGLEEELERIFVWNYEAKCVDLRRALLQKIDPIEPLHIGVEKDSKEGVVFVRFTSYIDCSSAFRSLHGTWFNGKNLVTGVSVQFIFQ
ncbi:unnamed protein product [Litomosoides sigmodontis]|uniref:LEM domain-containing protein n=1 Tax=Litomosoides sigmodontis TaxID=42156 RepID=A0A3P6T227_LITSI|nr:unnamed protein product [Litomosoides sigmodontis]